MEEGGAERPPGFPRPHSRLATDGAEVQAPSADLTLHPMASPQPVPRQALGSPGGIVPLVGESDSAGLTSHTGAWQQQPPLSLTCLRPGERLPGTAVLEPGLLTG